MHFDIETPVCTTTGEKCKSLKVCRVYANDTTSVYFATATLVLRKDDLWELTAWVSSGKGPNGYDIVGIKYLLNNGYRVSASFEEKRYKAFKRRFKDEFTLKPINKYTKVYNGKKIGFRYIEFLAIS